MKRDLEGKLAVVTGACSGIGLQFAHRLGERGCDVAMVSNNGEAIRKAAADIASAHNVRTYSEEIDLCANNAAEVLMRFIDSTGREPDLLINNAGIFSFAPVTETSSQKIDRFVSLHVKAVTDISRAAAMRMARQGHGRILNMSSMSCWAPMPGIAMYAATKAYIRVFSRALHYEMADSGITVTVACPGGIATDLFGLPDNLKRLALSIGALQTPEKFTRKALDRMLKGKRQYINGWLNRIGIVAVGITPTPVRMMVKRKMLDRGIRR